MAITEEPLRAQAGRRERVLDEHMYRLPETATWRALFRLQLFTASGLRPVAVATQLADEGEGTSLMNAAETCAATVWAQFFPAEPQPPIWIERMIPRVPDPDRPPCFSTVTFTVGPGRRLSAPDWQTVSGADVDALVGQPVDRERGDGYVPPEPKPVRPLRYTPMLVVRLPRPRPFREAACMAAGVPWQRRLGRQLVPRRAARDCCWYHGGNWQAVCTLAIRLAARADAESQPQDRFVLCHPDARALTGWPAQALESLILDPITPYEPWPSREGYVNGQHRAQAMIDTGVRRALIQPY